MREILFRGKRKHNGEWVKGLYITGQNNIGEILYMIKTEYTTFFIEPETIGQYTGLTDKNGEKIFEGDIVVVNTTSIDEEDGYGVIDWHEDTARFIVELPNLLVDFDNLYSYDCEVIGNIHDNPDLLRGDKNEYVYGE